jgi:hypothetical protein
MSRKRHARSLGASVALAAVLAVVPTSAWAQSTDLDRVEELSRVGRIEEARSVLDAWWAGARTEAPARELQRGLWLRGRLTVDPAQAELDYQRLIVLYPSGPYAPQALLRLAQAAHARGEADVASSHVASLVRDYPTSPSRTQAEAWMASAGPVPPRADPTVAPPAVTRVSPDSAAALRPAPGRAPAPADVVLDWFVQFGAFSDEDRAFELQRELVAAGLAARLVRVTGSGFLHVRLGRFGNRDDANRELQDVTRRGFTAAIVRDERAEEVVRR